MCKEYEVMYSPSCETTRNTADVEKSADGMILGPEDLSYQLYEVSRESSSIISTEDLKECLKKQLEFCFSRYRIFFIDALLFVVLIRRYKMPVQ